MEIPDKQYSIQNPTSEQEKKSNSILHAILKDGFLLKIAALCGILAIGIGVTMYFITPKSGSTSEAVCAFGAIGFSTACAILVIIWILKGIRTKER
ncbi:MAG: hypothetical protein PHY34_01560 [Patescibacteria group bacterium]|nr:hypothetical protein [Patescibacteria group bacterium]MDD5715092.1 hypothetical protein [Patescibacteria group bacterium]